MKSSEVLRLPTVGADYNRDNEQITRRTVEQHLEDLRGDLVDIRDTTDKETSLALKRHQFLLMGA
jgi:ribosomal protein S3AE